MARRKYDSPSDELEQSLVRWPKGLREIIKDRADDNDRSMNAEIVALVLAGIEAETNKPAWELRLEQDPEDLLDHLMDTMRAMKQKLKSGNS